MMSQSANMKRRRFERVKVMTCVSYEIPIKDGELVNWKSNKKLSEEQHLSINICMLNMQLHTSIHVLYGLKNICFQWIFHMLSLYFFTWKGMELSRLRFSAIRSGKRGWQLQDDQKMIFFKCIFFGLKKSKGGGALFIICVHEIAFIFRSLHNFVRARISN